MRFLKPLSELRWKRRRGSDVELRKRTLKLIGQNSQPVVINAEGEVLFDIGHETCQAAKELGWTEVEVFLKQEAVIPCG